MLKKISVTCAIIVSSMINYSCIPSTPTTNTPPSNVSPAIPETLTPPEKQNIGEGETHSTDKNTPKQAPNTNNKTEPSPQKHQARVSIDPDSPSKGIPFNVKVMELENKTGYAIQGTFGLSGTISRPDPQKDSWLLSGQFEFPTNEYNLKNVEYILINEPPDYSPGKPLPPNFVPQVMITFTLVLPSNATASTGNHKVPFKLEIPLPQNAVFYINFMTAT